VKSGNSRAQLRPIGVIRSILKTRRAAPKQGSEGAPDAWLEVNSFATRALGGLRVGYDIRSAVLTTAAVALTVLSAFGQVPSSTWVQLNLKKKPPARSGCVMIYDPVSQKTVLFGGYDGTQHVNDTWTFDGKKWKLIKTSVAPPARSAAGAAFDAKLQQVVIFGGYNGQYLNDTWMWNGATSTWTQAAPTHQPTAETLPMLFPDPISGRADLFGGYDGKFYQSTSWRWSNGDWHKLSPKQSPSARAAAVFGTNPVLKQIVMFGGLADRNPVNTWTFDGHTWTQQSPATQPSWRLLTGTVYDPRFSGVVTFGGFDGADENETWLWNGTDWSQLTPQQSPPPRESTGMAFDELHQRTIVFGGLNGNTLLNDTWVLQTQ
jgi:hypothetical protein